MNEKAMSEALDAIHEEATRLLGLDLPEVAQQVVARSSRWRASSTTCAAGRADPLNTRKPTSGKALTTRSAWSGRRVPCGDGGSARFAGRAAAAASPVPPSRTPCRRPSLTLGRTRRCAIRNVRSDQGGRPWRCWPNLSNA